MVNLILESTSQIGLDDIKKFLAENFKLEENLQIFELKKQEDKSSIGIQELKDFLNEFINLSFKKLAIIYTAEIMTLEAQNFLLKPLEDMSSSINFVLATSSEHSLLPTVKSRCITLRYNGNSVAQKNTSTFIFQNLIEENENEFFILLDKLLKECKKNSSYLELLNSWEVEITETESKEHYTDLIRCKQRITSIGFDKELPIILFLLKARKSSPPKSH